VVNRDVASGNIVILLSTKMTAGFPGDLLDLSILPQQERQQIFKFSRRAAGEILDLCLEIREQDDAK
jgi:hypothetical protein